MNKSFALDTNILIYLHDIDTASTKRKIAYELIAGVPVISAQVISEYLNVCSKKLKMSKHDAIGALMRWLPLCGLAPFSIAIYDRAEKLMNKYQFQLFDAIIVASALESGCGELYSEDMQHDLLVDNTLRIINPFIMPNL
jgi:predicted nucleic acid-binding protein